MPKQVTPKVFIIGETAIIESGLDQFLAHLGVPDWSTAAHSDAEKLIEVAGKSCYMSFSTDLNRNLTRVGTRNNRDYIQEQIIATRHGSVLEHVSVNFAFVDVSRVLTHELVRHRPGTAFSQVSGRFVRTDELAYYVPSVIKENEEADAIFYNAFATMEKWMKQLAQAYDIDNMKDMTMKKVLTSAFRRLIGNGQGNHIIFSANHRTLRHLIEVRTAKSAEEEIRIAFAEVFRIVSQRYPAIYDDAIIGNVDGIAEVVFASSKV